MTAKDFPGFEEPTPGSAPPAPTAAPPPLQAYAFEDEAAPAVPARKRNLVVGSPTAGPGPAAPAQDPAPVAPPEEEVQPGSAKDLWHCPHCGAGNKPQRTACRACGKSPQDAVVPPWYRRPLAVVAVVAVVVVLVVGWYATRPDLSRRPAEAAFVDEAVRQTRQREADLVIDVYTFTPRSRVSVVGRVVGQRPHPAVSGVTTVVVALGASAAEGAFDQVAVAFNGERTEVRGGRCAVLHLLGAVVDIPPRGGYLSLVGRAGTLAEGLDDGLVVVPTP